MNVPPDRQLRQAIREARRANQEYRQQANTGDGLYIPRAIPSPEHYHIIYHVPKDSISIPNYREVFVCSRDAYARLQDTALQAKHVEYYENGQIGVETPIHGRTGLWWIRLEVAACIRSTCANSVDRARRKRQLMLLPGTEEAGES